MVKVRRASIRGNVEREYLREKGEIVEKGKLTEHSNKAERKKVKLGRVQGNRERKTQLLGYEVKISLINRHIQQPLLNQLIRKLSQKKSFGLLYAKQLEQ